MLNNLDRRSKSFRNDDFKKEDFNCINSHKFNSKVPVNFQDMRNHQNNFTQDCKIHINAMELHDQKLNSNYLGSNYGETPRNSPIDTMNFQRQRRQSSTGINLYQKKI